MARHTVGGLLVCLLSLPSVRAVAANSGAEVAELQEAVLEELVDPYRAPLDSADVIRILSHESLDLEDGLVQARLWRLASRPDLALASLGRVRGSAAGLERARILLEFDIDRLAGASAWWAICGTSDQGTRSGIYRDILSLSTPDERERWAELEPGEPTCAWLHAFWTDRALRMAITSGERVALHYRRLARAREWFWIPRPRFSAGWSDFFGRPDSLPMDDRGMIYVRMGLPETSEGFSTAGGGEPGATLSESGGDVGGEQFSFSDSSYCWPYWRPRGYLIFCFSQTAADQLQRADGDYKIQQVIGGAPGTDFFHRYFMQADIPSAAKRDRVRRASRTIGGRFRDQAEASLDLAEARAYDLQTAVATNENVRRVLEGIPDTPDIESTVNLRFEPLRFLNPSTGTWQVWLLASARAGDLTPSEEGASAKLSLGGRYATPSPEGVAIEPLTTATVPASVPDNAGVSVRGVLTAASGPLPITLVVEDLNDPGTGAWYQDTINVPAVGGLPQLSDIAVAQAEGGTWTRDGQTFLQVSPAHITNLDGSIHTYFEAYGVRPGTPYEVELRLTEADAADRIWRLEQDDLAFRLQFTSEMPGDIGRHHLRLDLGDTEPGEYVLAVRIQDEETKAYSLPSVTDVFVAER